MRLVIISFSLLIVLGSDQLFCQVDTLNVMHYNCMNYGSYQGCQSNAAKDIYLRKIVGYKHPDVLSLVEVNANSRFANDTVLGLINYNCPNCYKACAYINSRPINTYKVAMVYYNQNKLGYVHSWNLYSDGISEDINLHKLYYKDPHLSLTNDTTFLFVINQHLVSGSGSADARTTQAQGVTAKIVSAFTKLPNCIVMGDFNVRASTEGCYQAFIAPADTAFTFNDPPNQLGDWKNSPASFTNYLTTSTNLVADNCGMTDGGAKGRYDHILLSNNLMKGRNYIKYIPNSFKVIGNDGNRTGNSVLSPVNTSAPDSVLNSLYYMSNHYPVSLKLSLSSNTVGGSEWGNVMKSSFLSALPEAKDFESAIEIYENKDHKLIISISNEALFGANAIIQIFDVQGKIVFSQHLTLSPLVEMLLPKGDPGIYLIFISNGSKILKSQRIYFQP